MYLRSLKARIERSWAMDGVKLHLFERLPDGKLSLLSGLVFKEYGATEMFEPSESINLPYATAQELMDELWQAGLRPSEGSGSAGSLRATENHLKDLQTLSWRLLSMIERGDK